MAPKEGNGERRKYFKQGSDIISYAFKGNCSDDRNNDNRRQDENLSQAKDGRDGGEGTSQRIMLEAGST